MQDWNTAALREHEYLVYQRDMILEADGGSTYNSLLQESFSSVIVNGDALQKFDQDTEGLFDCAQLVVNLLQAHSKGKNVAYHVQALYDGLKYRYELNYGEELLEKANALILDRN